MREILAAYSGLTVSSLLVSILAFTVLAKCFNKGDMGSSFKMALGIWLWSGFMFVDKAWWSIWRASYIRKDSSSWMLDHWVPLVSPIMMIIGMLLLVEALTEDSPYKMITQLCLGSILCVMLITYLGR